MLKLFLLLCYGTLVLSAQSTIAMYQRVWMIQTKHGRGTAFAADVDGREYWITAAHVLTGAKGKPYGKVAEKKITIELLSPGGDGETWVPFTFTVLQPEEDVDIVVLVPEDVIIAGAQPGPPISNTNFLLGATCEFMGYPYGGGWRLKTNEGSYWVAFTKKCGVSGMDREAHLWILDGINNQGFSGGPVFVGTGDRLQIIAVVSGYHLEPAEVIKGRPSQESAPNDTVRVNSGFVLAYDISLAADLIKKNPIGPLRAPKVGTPKQ